MIVRWILTTISIFIIAYIIGKMVKKEEVLNGNIKEDSLEATTFYVENNYCIGCGLCKKLSPLTFTMENKKAKIINDNLDDNIIETINKCPAKAIKYK